MSRASLFFNQSKLATVNSRGTVIQTVVLSAILFYLSWQMLSPLHFLVSDTGLRFIQTQELIANNWQSLAISYPQRVFDYELEHMPFTGAAAVVNGQIFLYVSPFLTIIAAYFYTILGSGGLAVAPTAGGVFTAVALYKLGRLIGLPYPRLLLWVTVFATPILIYSVKLWDHTLATALAAWAVYFLSRGLYERPFAKRFLFAGGLCLGLGLGQRPEMYTFALAAAGGLLLVARPIVTPVWATAIGGLSGALPIWVSQWLWVGHPLGMFVAPNFLGYGRVVPSTAAADTVATSTRYFLKLMRSGRFLFDVPDEKALIASVCLVVGAAVITLAVRSQPRRLSEILLLGLIMVLVGYRLWFDLGSRTFVVGIFPTLPLFVFMLAYPGYHGRWAYNQQIYKFVASIALLFLALMLTLWPAYGGFQWGSRYLLPVYPLLLFMGWFTFASYEQFLGELNNKAQFVWRAAAISLLITSVALQFTGLRTLRLRHQELGQIQTAIADLPAEMIITNHYFLGSVMAPLSDKQFFYVSQKEDIEKLAQRFVAGGVRQIAIIPGTYFIPEHPPLEIPDRAGPIILQEIEPLIYELR